MQQAFTSIRRPGPGGLAHPGDGLLIRSVVPADAARMHDFLLGLSLRSVQQRFWSGGPNLLRLTRELTTTDRGRHGLVACGRGGAIVAHGEYALLSPRTAEVALVVCDGLQGRGLGTQLVEQLTGTAADAGITRFIAAVHPENVAMLQLFTRHFGASVRQLGDECRVEFPLSASPLRDAA